MISRFLAEQMQSLYLAGIDSRHPVASPLYADLQDLPPLLVQVGSDEVLLSDSTGFAENARMHGVEITLEVWPEMQHVWQYVASIVPESRQAIDRIGEFIKASS